MVAVEPPPADAPRPADATGPPEPWTSAAMTGRSLLWVAGSIVVLFTALSVPVGLGGAGIGLWLLGALLCGLVLATTRIRTVIDADGVSVRAPGFRVLHVPLAQLARADVLAEVDRFWEFGAGACGSTSTDARGW